MMRDDYGETPRGPMTLSEIKCNFFTKITKLEFDKLFTNQNFIGSGTQGQVYSAFYQGQIVAIKYFRRESLGPQLIYYIQSQIQSLNEIRHQNILSLISTYQVIISNYCKKFCIVTEYCESNLNNIQKIMPLTDFQKMNICYQMIAGIAAAHQRGIMHRDIKPQNILIKNQKTLQIKIADFGCSKMKDDGISLTTYIGTPLFADPNIKEGKYSVKCDVYSAGLVIVNIFCGRHFFSDCHQPNDLQKNKRKFSKDITVSAVNFFEEFDESEINHQIKAFLVDIAIFTLENQEQGRYSAPQLLCYIKNQLKNFEEYNFQAEKVSKSCDHNPKSLYNDYQNSPMKKKKIQSDYMKPQEVQSSPDMTKMKKKNTLKQNSQFFYSETPSDFQKSQITVQTDDNSQKILIQKQLYIFKPAQQDESFEDCLDHSFENSSKRFGDKSFDQKSQINVQSPTKSQKNNLNNSFVSSDSNEFQKKWNNDKTKGYSIKMFRSSKASSQIVESRLKELRSRKSIEEQSLRQKRIDQKQKSLSQFEILCAQMIRYCIQFSGINEQGQAMNAILATFNLIRTNFEMVKKIEEINQTIFSKAQKQVVAFLFHFLYAGKMKDLRLFVLGQPSNLKLNYVKISSKRRETICNIVDKELIRIFDNLKNYSNDLKRNVELIKPKLSDTTKKSIDDTFRCTSAADLLTKINCRDNDIKQETRNFIQEIQERKIVTKNQMELKILKDLCIAIGRMCQ